MSDTEYHWYSLTFQYHAGPGQTGYTETCRGFRNQLQKKCLDQVRKEAVPNYDSILINAFYMGYMTEKEFHEE